jgi:hypothetical protein
LEGRRIEKTAKVEACFVADDARKLDGPSAKAQDIAPTSLLGRGTGSHGILGLFVIIVIRIDISRRTGDIVLELDMRE